MKLKLHHNSLFAVLARSPWWMSALLAAGIFAATRMFLETAVALFAAAPFIAVALYAVWKALRTPSAGRVARTLARIGAMPRAEFTAALAAGFRRQGYEIERAAKGGEAAAADLELRRAGRLTLVACRRWKAASTGVEALRELHAAGCARDAHELVYVAAGELSAQARGFAEKTGIRVLQGAELAALVG